MAPHPWHNKIGNPAQLGGIETSVLDNGAGRGVRIAWVNTGTGLRYKVVLDRGMDIADAFFNEHSLTWLSHGGITAPQPLSSQKLEWLRQFGGGLLTTCGLTHVGGPEQDEHGERGLHGYISNQPAELQSIVLPDPARGKLDFSLTGLMRETTVFGPSLELKRTISGTIGQPTIRIQDEVTNQANTPSPHMLLYHLNFGWPLVDEGTKLVWEGSLIPRPGHRMSSEFFREGNDVTICPPPIEAHSGTGEVVAFIDAAADEWGQCRAGLENEKLGLTVTLRWPKAQMPWLTNWQHWGRGEYVTGIEPGTHPPIGQAAARTQNTLLFLDPGETRLYNLALSVVKN